MNKDKKYRLTIEELKEDGTWGECKEEKPTECNGFALLALTDEGEKGMAAKTVIMNTTLLHIGAGMLDGPLMKAANAAKIIRELIDKESVKEAILELMDEEK